MASEQSDDELLGIGNSSSNQDQDLVSKNEAVDDITCLEEETLLSSVSPPNVESKTEPNENTIKTTNNETKVDEINESQSVNESHRVNETSTTIKPDITNYNAKHFESVNDPVIIDDDDILEITDDEGDENQQLPSHLSVSSDDSNSIKNNNFEQDDEEYSSEDYEDTENSEDESDESCTIDGKVNIFYSHGSLFIWNAEDAQMLREECRIIGKLTGSLPRAPRQNNHLGLPLQLMPEEAKLLVELDAAVVVVDEDTVSASLQKMRDTAFNRVREQNIKIQQQLYKNSRRQDVQHRLKDIIAGKKAKKQKQLTQNKNGSSIISSSVDSESSPPNQTHTSKTNADLCNQTTDASSPQNPSKISNTDGNHISTTNAEESPKNPNNTSNTADSLLHSGNTFNANENLCTNSDSNLDGPSPKRGKLNETAGSNDNSEDSSDSDEVDNLEVDDILKEEPDTSAKHCLVQIFTENPWRHSVRPCQDWKFPMTERERLRYCVFKDLWEKGFYLTSGSKFGGDFLVYPGDPARYHSHYIAICKTQHEEIHCLDIVTLGRLASNVRKTALLCTVDRSKSVVYTSLKWTGIT
ncbi:tRNA-splicing endonuclease subunit Sen34-like [Physella acuta]|uniref:tRNA-splicing endonuclease subunit Sen34-like n=1 Tax=Physella acuta TaxID=109671 RepID=UPI0027DD39B5|nr:tRNA-splicing endonuclease subunit Sen34-like [Physella acuta]